MATMPMIRIKRVSHLNGTLRVNVDLRPPPARPPTLELDDIDFCAGAHPAYESGHQSAMPAGRLPVWTNSVIFPGAGVETFACKTSAVEARIACVHAIVNKCHLPMISQ
jgi:hypothetical protein